MFLKKNLKNMRSLFTVFAVFALAATMLWWGANNFTAGATTKLHDFTGEGRTDFTLLQFTTGGPITWKILGNPTNPAPNGALIRVFNYGLTDQDSITALDFVGDSKCEVGVYRDFGATASGTAGVYYLAQFPTGSGGITLDRAVRHGDAFTDVPTGEGDYDGDGKADYTVVRVSNSNLFWYIMSSSTGAMRTVPFGSLTGRTGVNLFPGADFNGDGRDELIIVSRNSAGTLDTIEAGDAVSGVGVRTQGFGNYNTDFQLAPRDYTGDGKADFVAVRETTATATWYIMDSATNAVTATSFGIADPTFADLDLPVRGDFDGDGKQDICVYRDSNQTFYYKSSAGNGAIQAQKAQAAPGDFPIGSFGEY